MLRQDDNGGLYVRWTKGNNWIHVNPINNALTVIIYSLDTVIGPFPQLLRDGEKQCTNMTYFFITGIISSVRGLLVKHH
ncbi:hypothetical protein H5410_057254 [Solanum commersonii]|uniref:Uncharacterized protein n=1 Tax=Solanum commersonii TaxID=4109 RepID=A0A9J5WQ27_SOLCO|nr:hypothetical protein H5410_057254 [Solanum commersonii]